jgi:predicted nucleotidyltransferase
MTLGTVVVADQQLAGFCKRWRIIRLELFGSACRPDFRPDSDIDLLVTFEEDVPWTLLDMVDMQEELEAITGHKVDLVSRKAVEQDANWIRRNEILGSAEPVYVA